VDKIAIGIGERFNSPIGDTVGLADLVSLILGNAILVAAVIFFFLILFGGISVIVGAGQDDPERAAKGKKAVTTAVIGFIIIFVTYWIIVFIQRLAGFQILSPPDII
jgi:hypothetical protein